MTLQIAILAQVRIWGVGKGREGEGRVTCPIGYYCLQGGTRVNQYPYLRGTFGNETGYDDSTGCNLCTGKGRGVREGEGRVMEGRGEQHVPLIATVYKELLELTNIHVLRGTFVNETGYDNPTDCNPCTGKERGGVCGGVCVKGG